MHDEDEVRLAIERRFEVERAALRRRDEGSGDIAWHRTIRARVKDRRRADVGRTRVDSRVRAGVDRRARVVITASREEQSRGEQPAHASS